MLRRMEVYLLEIPLNEPFRISSGTSTRSTNIVIRLVDANGNEGWGEASPSRRVLNETLDTVKTTLKNLFPKVGIDPKKDIERIKAIRDAVGYDIILRVDANQGWSVNEAIYVIDKLADYEVELVEQPIRWDDLKGLRRVRKESSIPIAADESVKTPSDAIKVIEADAVDIINIKLMKSRGIWGALKIASISEAAGIKNMIGCMGESRIGITAGVHVAQGLKNIMIYDLDSDLLLKEDVVIEGGASIEQGVRRAGSDSGLGIKNVRKEMLTQISVLK